MRVRCGLLSYLILLVALGAPSSVGAGAQTADAPKKNCTLASATYQADPPPPPHGKTSGVVTLGVFVDENGRVSGADILNSSGDNKFDNAALTAVKKWRFKPSLCDGKPFPIRIAVQMQSGVN